VVFCPVPFSKKSEGGLVMALTLYEAGKRFTEQKEIYIKKQIQNPRFFKGIPRDWLQGYIDGVKERYPHLVEALLKNPSLIKELRSAQG
jgi:hypothetical protein